MAIELQSQDVAREAAGGHARARPRRPLRARERMFFTERLALLLASGNALYESLGLLASQSGTGRLAGALTAIRDDVADGRTFAQALSRHPDEFPATYVNLVAAAETGGFLPEVLGHLAQMEGNNARLRSTVVSAFSYPVFLVTFSALVVVFVLAVVFPKFAVMFAAIADELPFTTRWLMALSDVLRAHWALLPAVAAVPVAAVFQARRNPALGAAFDRVLLRAPGLRQVFATWYTVQLLRVMGLSLDHGVSVYDALRAARDVASNREYRALVAALSASVEEGRGLSPAVERSTLLPPLARQMICTAEQSGQLARTMSHLADFYERELTRWLQMATRLAEPVLLLVMGVVVGGVVSSLILPIFKLARAVH